MNNLAGLYGGIDMAKVMMGQNAFQMPINIILQDIDAKTPEIVAGVFQSSQGAALRCGSKKPHVLVLGDMMFRPRIVVASSAFCGRGISSLYRDGFTDMETWLAEGDVLLGPSPEEIATAHADIQRSRG